MSDTIATANVDLFGKNGYAYNDSLSTINFNNGFIIGTYGQRVNIQTGGVATSGNYSPYTEADQGATGHSLSFLKTNVSTDPTTAFMTTSTAYTGPFDVVVWITGGKGSVSYTEKLEVSVANALTDAVWTVLDTLSTLSDKYIRKRVAYYDETAPVFVKIASVSNIGTNSNMLIFDLKLMGEGQDPVQVNKPMIDRTLVSTRIYTISGTQVKSPVYGVNIIRNIYSDGSVETVKISVKERK